MGRTFTRNSWIRALAAAIAAVLIAYGTVSGGGLAPSHGAGQDAAGHDAGTLDEEFWDDEADMSDETPEPAPAPEEPEGASMQERLDRYIESSWRATGTQGLAVAVVDPSGTIYQKLEGDLTSVHDTTLIGSLSKSFAALATMQLVEAGRIDLDAPVVRYVSGYDLPDTLTVRMLVNQTSGFGFYDALDEARCGDTFGTFSYANANYDLLGRIVEAVSGEPYADYVQHHILEPLGMEDSSASMEGRARAKAHRNYFGVNVADGFVHQDSDAAWGTASSGYVATSIADMERYLRMYLNEGQALPEAGERVLSADGIRQMFLSRAPDPWSGAFYGMGWISYYWDSEIVLCHEGDVENGVAYMCVLPERGLAIAVLSDTGDVFGGNGAFCDLADGIVATVAGGEAAPVSGDARIASHTRENIWLAAMAAIAVAPLFTLRRWRRTLGQRSHGQTLLRLLLVHGAVPAFLLYQPIARGHLWRDVLTFAPDVSLVLAGGAAFSLALGLAKLVAAVVVWRRQRA